VKGLVPVAMISIGRGRPREHPPGVRMRNRKLRNIHPMELCAPAQPKSAQYPA
jgi:hypothetical protein